MDWDYLNKLSPTEKAWLNKFTEEYVNASFDKRPRKNIQKTKRLRKDCYDRNNARNRDIYLKAKMLNRLVDLEQINEDHFESSNEDSLIDQLDRKRKLTSE